MSDRIEIGTRVIVALPGLRGQRKHGVVVDPELVMGYWVLIDGETKAQRFSDKKVKSERSPIKRSSLGHSKSKNMARASSVNALASQTASNREWDTIMLDGLTLPMRIGGKPTGITQAVVRFPRQDKPEQSEAYKAWIRTLECCNCAAPPPGDPHHEGKKGMSQKVRDTLCVPLCRPCHSYYTATNRLPDPEQTNRAGKVISRSRTESLAVLQGAQAHLTAVALERLPLAVRVEVQSKALAGLSEEVLSQALR